MLLARRAIPGVAAATGLGLGTAYAIGPTARDDELPRQWDRSANAAYWRARPLASASRALEVAATLAPVAARIAADRTFVAADEPAAERAARQRLRATQARDALVELGPAFIRLGQQLSIRPDVVPPPALEVLRGLCLCGNQISGAPRHRRDVVSVAVSARWRGVFRPWTRRCRSDRVGSKAWRFTKVHAIYNLG